MQSLNALLLFSACSAEEDLSVIMNKYKYSVVRIINVAVPIDIFEPYVNRGSYAEDIGSGFAVNYNKANDDPSDHTFMTNGHVIRNGRKIYVQLPSLSRKKYEAWVPLVSFELDLAVVKLKNSSELNDDLARASVTLHKMRLHVKPGPPSMGTLVWAFGYSLGSNWVKLSQGVMAGAEDVWDYMVFQSTAPISPGNSGGPLVMRNEDPTSNNDTEYVTVVGINFASAASINSQNNNYIIPGFRIAQVLEKYVYCKDQEIVLDHCGSGTWKHIQLKIAPVGVVTTPSSDAQITASQGCTGIVLQKFKTYSMFRYADPPILPGSFLARVDDTVLDSFGMGKRENFMAGYVRFQDLLTMRATLDDDVPVTTCINGEYQEHVLSLVWNSSLYEPGVGKIYETRYAKQLLQYEVFAGMTLMQMTQNHVHKLMRMWDATSHLACYEQEENQVEPKVMITAVTPGSSVDELLEPGMIVESVNNVRVRTLQELRDAFEPISGETWQLLTDRGNLYVGNFTEELTKSVQSNSKSIQSEGWVPLSEAVKAALSKRPSLVSSTGLPLPSSFLGGGEEKEDDEEAEDKDQDVFTAQEENESRQLKELANTASKGAAETSIKDSSFTDRVMKVVNRIVSGLDTHNAKLKEDFQNNSSQSITFSSSRSAEINSHGMVGASMRRAIVS